MTYPATPTAPPPAKPKGAFLTGIVLVVLSIVIFVGCVIWGTLTIVNTAADAVTFRAPGEVTTTLEAGEHAVWSGSSFLFPSDVTITGPGGEVTGADYGGGDGLASITKDGRSFSPEVTFTAPTTGSYTIAVDDRGPSTEVLVGPPGSAVTRPFAAIFAAFLVCSLLGTIGLILFIVGLVKRSRAKKAQRPPPGPYGAPGPYPQPAYGQPAPYPHPGAPGGPPAAARPPGPPGMGPPPRP